MLEKLPSSVCLDETEGKSVCMTHEISSMTTKLLAIRDCHWAWATSRWVRASFTSALALARKSERRSSVISPSLHLHDQKVKEWHNRNVLDDPDVL